MRIIGIVFLLLPLMARASEKNYLCDETLGSKSPMQSLSLYRANMYGGKVPNDKVSIQNFKALFNKSSSMEELLLNFPRGLRRDFILINNSLSSQFGNTQKPRVLLSNSDSTFIFTFTGDRDQRGYNRAEVVFFDNKKREFIPYEVQFGENKKIIKNPSSCTKCHGQKWRPIWDSYPFWPRTFGSVNVNFLPNQDLSSKGEKVVELVRKETQFFNDFLNERKKGRYTALVGSHTLQQLVNSNNSFTINLLSLRAQQINKQIDLIAMDNPDLIVTLRRVFYHLSDNSKQPINLPQYLSDSYIKKYNDEIREIRSKVRDLIYKVRTRKLNEHFEAMGLQKISPKNIFNREQIGISDFDFEFILNSYTSEEENLQGFENSVENYSALYFLWVRLLKQPFSDLNLALDPNELPTFASPLKNGWREFY